MADKKLWRIFIYGEPNRGKTGCIVETFPRPMYVINAPGEGGGDSLPINDPQVVVAPPFDPILPPGKIIAAVEKTIIEAVKSGKYQTLVLEGLQNLTDYIMDDVTDGAYSNGARFEGSNWTRGGRVMMSLLAKLTQNTVPVVAVTGWAKSKNEKWDDPKSPKYITNALAGEMATKISGVIPNVFYQYLKKTGEQDANGRYLQQSMWMTKPYGIVKSAGMKGDYRITSKFPLEIPADFRYLSDTWDKLSKEVNNV